MIEFPLEVEAVLRLAGWFPGRSVPVHQWVDPLEALGYRASPAAVEILATLGGLTVVPPPDASNLFFPSPIVFDPVFAASSEFDRVAAWQTKYGIELFPLGEYDPVYLLLCAPDKRIFGAREGAFSLLGDTIQDALDLRIHARRPPAPYPTVRH